MAIARKASSRKWSKIWFIDMKIIREAMAAAADFNPLVFSARGAHNPRHHHGSLAGRSGTGHNFWEFRSYSYGENARRIDWRQSARGDAALVREQEAEEPNRVFLYVDPGTTMHYNSRGNIPTKLYAARRMVLAITSLLLRGGAQVDVLFHPRQSAQRLDSLARDLQIQSTDITKRPMPNNIHGAVIFCGDFHHGKDTWTSIIQPLAAKGIKGYCIQMLDPAEVTLPFYGATELQSMTDDNVVYLPNADSARPYYQQRLNDEQKKLKSYCQSIDWLWHTATTEQNPRHQLQQWLLVR